MFTLEYTDGYYIAKDGDEGVLDLVEPENREFAEFVVNALNAAQLQRAADDVYEYCPHRAFVNHPACGDVVECEYPHRR